MIIHNVKHWVVSMTILDSVRLPFPAKSTDIRLKPYLLNRHLYKNSDELSS